MEDLRTVLITAWKGGIFLGMDRGINEYGAVAILARDVLEHGATFTWVQYGGSCLNTLEDSVTDTITLQDRGLHVNGIALAVDSDDGDARDEEPPLPLENDPKCLAPALSIHKRPVSLSYAGRIYFSNCEYALRLTKFSFTEQNTIIDRFNKTLTDYNHKFTADWFECFLQKKYYIPKLTSRSKELVS